MKKYYKGKNKSLTKDLIIDTEKNIIDLAIRF
jgi:hypothetical protein